ncbi:methyltransferase domain-containing protein [Actinomadura sp. NAK00032]|uniref:class I SAM-dependent methyltransferase n=1 Tax=Actinomadura sp. NAK00032 TaxID=2742128 RepID=UPI001591508A|nr:methyltransferase domain-containing protein [Actinomadura sp. NAK00032]QKW37525.1 methyltransferase domain-containing protein [Actinomadura sp. NAK00032]
MQTAGTSLKQRAIGYLVGQARRPRGLVGWANGWMFALRPSNRRRNLWAVSLLDVRPTDRVLEIGFGPGIAIAAFAGRATRGEVFGIDHSRAMVRHAARRNAAAVRAGRVHLAQASVERLPGFGDPLDAVLAVNSAGFWPDPVERLRELRRLLRPAGRIALVSQPRCPGATSDTTARAARELQDMLTQAGFTDIQVETLDLDPPAACVLATSPAS